MSKPLLLSALLVALLASAPAGAGAPRKFDQRFLAEDGTPNPYYDPLKAFWMAPSYAGLTAYGEFLEERRLTPEQRHDPDLKRPPDPEFERMKARLARGVVGPRPRPHAAWAKLKQAATDWKRLAAELAREMPEDPDSALYVLNQKSFERFEPLPDGVRIDGGHGSTSRALALVDAIVLPAAEPSLFRTTDELAGPREGIEAVSGRFGIAHRIRTAARERAVPPDDWRVGGSWDIGSVRRALVRPVTGVRVYRDGRIESRPTRMASTAFEWSEVDGPQCPGFVAGFSVGDADRQTWRGYGMSEQVRRDSQRIRPRDSLLHFHVRATWQGSSRALVTYQRQTLDRARTGFASATSSYFDLDGDGRIDLAVWEGSGRGPGHLGEGPAVDVTFRRMFFANIAGHWYLLGSDDFAPGCGC